MAKKQQEKTVEENSNIIGLIDELFKDNEDYIKMDEIDDSVTDWINSGNYALNFILSNSFFKGYPVGRITSLCGLPGSGKSLFLSTALRDVDVNLGVIFETEGGGLSTSLLNYAKVPLNKIRQMKVRTFDCFKTLENGTIEEIKDNEYNPKNKDQEGGLIWKTQKFIDIIKQSKNDKKIILGIDSIANLTSAKELSGSQDMGKRSQLTGKFFRIFDNVLEKLNIACLITNKLYTAIGASKYEEQFTVAGGLAPEYNSSTILQLEKVSNSNTLTDAEIKEERENVKSARGASVVSIKVKNIKSRFGCYGRQIILQLDMVKGVQLYSGLFDVFNDYGLLERKGAYYSFVNKEISDKNFLKKDFETFIASDPINLLKKVELEIYKIQKDEDKKTDKLYNIEDEEKNAEFDIMTKAIEKDVDE